MSSAASSSDQLTSSSDQLTSSIIPPTSEINSSFAWPAEHDLAAGVNIPTAADDCAQLPKKTTVTPSSTELDVENESHQEDEQREDLDASRVAASISITSTHSARKKARAAYTTEDPWCSLISSLTKLIHGENNVTFPVALLCMSPTHTHLFEHAVESLKKYQAQGVDRDVTLLKDAQVAMSCVLNTMSANAQEYFASAQRQELLDQACSLSVIEGFDNHPSTAIAQEYVDCLAKHGVDGLKKQLIVDRGILNNKYMECKGLPPEADMRDKVLEILTKLDETMLEASKVMRHMQSLEHGDVSDAGRKVDCIFMYKGIELSNIEFKRAEIGERDLAIQNRKNVRLARCIQEFHASLGVEDPSIFMADVHGFVGVFYQVRPMGDIAIAGKTTSDLVHLPRTAGGLKAFLQGSSLAILWNFLASLEAQAPVVQLAKELHEVEHEKANFTRAIHRNRAFAPPPVQRRFQDHVLFTPQKKRPRAKTQDD
ncbi:hypothetical protein BGZ59_001795 [Podila verticillata]|nr:hypothetical protein BGZ59_001795 [Podila verticillata]